MSNRQPDLDPALPRGVKLLHDPQRNKGTAFTAAEREALGLRGLLPPRPQDQDAQVARVLGNLAAKTTDLERYVFLTGLQDRNERLFYRVLTDHLEQLMPIVYTPTVGHACERFGHIFRRPRGLYVSAADRGQVRKVLANWPHADVRVIVVTDGERILGLGDLGANGMGIPIGKLALYTACAGIPPTACLPIMLDVGTENEALLADPLYIGLAQRRLRGDAFDELVDELVEAVGERFPRAILQFEDFATGNAFRLLDRYRDRICCFNDDIEGTAAVTLAGLRSALRLTGGALRDGRYLFLGAGEAGLGIGHLLVAAMTAEGASAEEAHDRLWFCDSHGLVTRDRADLSAEKRRLARAHAPAADFVEVLREARPTVLIGVCGTPGRFDRVVLETFASFTPRPVVLALSNPTSKSECTARQAYEWSGGRAVFASGSPFAPVELDGRILVPGQCNNAYVFPGVGLGLLVAEARRVTDSMFLAAAQALAAEVTDADLASGRIYPSLARIREVSGRIAAAVAEVTWAQGLARRPRPPDLEGDVAAHQFDPAYPVFVSEVDRAAED
jgi:malate dehydrogenase (oxaloacetate-decarboxylating)(NADP+)